MLGRWTTMLLRAVLLCLTVSFTLPLSTTISGVRVYPFDLILLPLLALCLLVARHVGEYQFLRVDLLLVVFSVFSVLSIFYTDSNISGGMLLLRGCVVFIAVRLLYGAVYTGHDIVNTATGVVLVQGGLGLLQFLLQSNIGAMNQYFGVKKDLVYYENIFGIELLQIQGTFSSPNILGLWLVFLGPLVLFGWYAYDDCGRVRTASIGLCLVGIMSTLSLGFVVIMVVTGAMFTAIYLFRSFITSRLFQVGGIASVIGLSILPLLLSPVVSIGKRTKLTNLSIEIISGNPLVGVGYDQFVPVVKTMGINDLFFRSAKSSVHNIFLLLSAEVGLVSSLLFTLWVFSCVGLYVYGWSEGHRSNLYCLASLVTAIMASTLYIAPLSFQFYPMLTAVLGSTVSWTNQSQIH